MPVYFILPSSLAPGGFISCSFGSIAAARPSFRESWPVLSAGPEPQTSRGGQRELSEPTRLSRLGAGTVRFKVESQRHRSAERKHRRCLEEENSRLLGYWE